MIEQRQIPHVQRQRAAGTLLINDDGDRAAFHAFAEADAATAGEARVGEAFQHLKGSYYRSALISWSTCSFVTGPMCLS